MRWIRFSTAGRTCYGVIEGDRIAESGESPFEGWQRTGRTHLLEAVKIAIPVVPRTFYAAGLNYVAHVTHAAHLLGNEPDLPEKPDIGYRANNALIAHDEEVVIPRDATEKVQYEGELVVVIGEKAKNLSEAEALSCVLGYTIATMSASAPGSAATARCGGRRTPTRSSRWGRGSRPTPISMPCRRRCG